MIREVFPESSIDPCLPFQMDISCMIDEELNEDAVRRAVVHIETCRSCRGFWDALRGQVVVHNQLAQPQRLNHVLRMLEESNLLAPAKQNEQLRKLAIIFFRLGKAYIMLVADKKYQFRLLEEPVAVQAYTHYGKEYIKRNIYRRKGKGLFSGYNWVKARYVLHGRLEETESNLEKGKLLLEESLKIRSRFSEPRHYLALYHLCRGEKSKSKNFLYWILHHSKKRTSRARAAAQLGMIHATDQEFREAIHFARWALREDGGKTENIRFAATYNIAIYHAQLGQIQQAGEYFRKLIRANPNYVSEVKEYLHRSEVMRNLMAQSEPFARELQSVSPELVGSEK